MPDRLMLRRAAVAVLLAALPLAGCATDSAPDIAGVWRPDDGSGLKTIGDDGACSGMYYSSGRILDIGGAMTCTLGDKPDANGRYTLIVRQPPNQRTYTVKFPDKDTMVLSNPDVTLTRQ